MLDLEEIVIKTIGATRVNQEVWPGDNRVFSDSFFKELIDANKDLVICLEEGYWIGTEYTKEDYESALGDKLKWVSRVEAFKQDAVLAFKYPSVSGEDERVTLEYEMLPTSVLISMVHFKTRAKRVDMLSQNLAEVFSLDSAADSVGRVTFDRAGTAKGSLLGYEIVKKLSNNFEDIKNNRMKVIVLGGGNVGSEALKQLYGHRFKNKHGELLIDFRYIDLNESKNNEYIVEAMTGAHMIIDAAYRDDPKQSIITKEHMDLMDYKVVVDLAGDDPKAGEGYVKAVGPINVLGNLNQLVYVGDYDTQEPMQNAGRDNMYRFDEKGNLLAIELPKEHEFKKENVYVATCGSWPGVYSLKNFRDTIESRLIPIMRQLVKNPEDRDKRGTYYEQLQSGLLSTYNKSLN